MMNCNYYMNFDITLNIRQAIECCAPLKRLYYLNQNLFTHITHYYPYQICIKKTRLMHFFSCVEGYSAIYQFHF